MDEFINALDEYMKLLSTSHNYYPFKKLDDLEWKIRRMGNELIVEMGEDKLDEQLSEIPLMSCRADDAWRIVK